ncbi:MAG: hypothetical protein HY063_14330 [Bacteroidetes bacterium]|nr:hypothetical protein [Bacteroidota bacterium]
MAKSKKASQQEWIGVGDADFDSGQSGFMVQVNANFGAWNIPAADVTNLQNLQAAWNTAYAAGGKGHRATRDEGDTQAKKDAKKFYVAGIRQFIAQWLRKNKSVSDAQRKLMRITVADTTKTKHKDPIEANIFYEHKNMGGGKHQILCRDLENIKKSHTADTADGVLVSYSIVDVRALQAKAELLAEMAQENPSPAANKKAADALVLIDPPDSPDNCDKQKVFSGAKFILDLGNANIGKTLFMYLQWNDSKNPVRASSASDLITISI